MSTSARAHVAGCCSYTLEWERVSRRLLALQDSREGGFAGGDGDEVAAAVEPCGVFVGRVDHEAADSDLLAHSPANAPGVLNERPAETAPLGAAGDGETGEQDGGDRIRHVAVKRAALTADTRGRQREIAGQQPIVVYDHIGARTTAPMGSERAFGEPPIEIFDPAVEERKGVPFIDRARLGERQPKSRS